MHPCDLFTLGAVTPPSTWFESGCGGPRARWTSEGLIEIENEGAKSRALPEGVKKWRDLIVTKANKYDLLPQFVAGVMALESGGKQDAVSSANAYGLMQLLSKTASDEAGRKVTGEELLNDADLNVDLGAKFLASLMKKYGGNPIKVTASYNAGSPKCGVGAKCTAPNRWSLVTDCGKDGVSVDYPSIAFGYTNAAAVWLGSNPTVSKTGPSLGALAVGALVVGGIAWVMS